MKQFLLFLGILISINIVSAQNVGIGTASPKDLSKLDVESTTSGFLLPRMTTIQRNTLGGNVSALGATISAQYNGLMVYDITNNTLYMWDSNKTDFANGGWNNVLDADASVNDADADPTNEIQDLSLSGNTLSLSGDATTVNLAPYLDNTDDQKIDVFNLSGTTLNLSLESDGEADKTVDLSGFKDHNFYEIGQTRGADNINDNIFTNGRVQLNGTTDASGTAGTGVLEISNTLRLDGNEIITDTNTPLYLQNDNGGDLIVDNPTFVVDASADRVGVGTTTPTEKLDVSGNIHASGIVYWGNTDTRTETRSDAGLQGNAGAKSGFYETNSPSPAANWPSGASSWWHLLDIRHSNSTNNYAMQFAGSFFNQELYFRKTNNNPAQAWSRIMTSNDINGTTNYVSKFTSANSLGNSQIYDDGTNVRVTNLAGTGNRIVFADASGNLKIGANPDDNYQWSLASNLSSSPDDFSASWTSSVDEGQWGATMSFSIRIDGVDYNTVSMATNGAVIFGTTTSTISFSNNCLPTSNVSTPTIFWYWDDMVTRYRWFSQGTAPNRTFVIDFDSNVYGTGDDVDGVVQIHENGLIQISYRVADPPSNGQGATIGFQRAGGSAAIAHPISCNAKVMDDNRRPEEWSVSPVK